MDEDAHRLLYTANTEQTPTVPPVEVNQNFIHVQKNHDTEGNIANNMQSEFTKVENINRFFMGQDDIAEECLANLKGIESATNLYSVYNQDVERKGELVIDGSLYTTVPVKNKCQKSVLTDKLKTNLPSKKTVSSQLKSKVPKLGTDARNSNVVANTGNLISSNVVADDDKLGVTSVTNFTSSSKSIILKGEESNQDADVHTGDREATETHVRFQTCDSSPNCILLGPDSGNEQVYECLKEQAAELYGAFPGSTVKECVISVDVLVKRNLGAKDPFPTSERDGYMTPSAKCLADTVLFHHCNT